MKAPNFNGIRALAPLWLPSWSARGLLLVLSSGLAVLAAEGALRLFSPGYSPLFLDIYRIDGSGHVGLIPGVHRRHTSAEWSVDVDINGHGLRNRPHGPGEAATVLVLGDSFTFGWGVDVEGAFPMVLERELERPDMAVVNAGIPGTGPTDQLVWVRRHGEAYRPRVLLVGFYIGNDFVDVQMGGVPGQFTVREGLMVRKTLDEGPAPMSRQVIDWLKRSSLLAQRAAEILWAFERRTRPEDRPNPGLTVGDRWLWEFFKIHLKALPVETGAAIEQTLAALDEMDRWAGDHGASLAVLLIPQAFQVYEWQRQRVLEAYGMDESALDLDRPQRVLTDWAGARGVPVLDLLPVFRRYAAAREDRLYFYPNNHMNATGHRVTGNAAAPFLEAVLARTPTP